MIKVDSSSNPAVDHSSHRQECSAWQKSVPNTSKHNKRLSPLHLFWSVRQYFSSLSLICFGWSSFSCCRNANAQIISYTTLVKPAYLGHFLKMTSGLLLFLARRWHLCVMARLNLLHENLLGTRRGVVGDDYGFLRCCECVIKLVNLEQRVSHQWDTFCTPSGPKQKLCTGHLPVSNHESAREKPSALKHQSCFKTKCPELNLQLEPSHVCIVTAISYPQHEYSDGYLKSATKTSGSHTDGTGVCWSAWIIALKGWIKLNWIELNDCCCTACCYVCFAHCDHLCSCFIMRSFCFALNRTVR